MIKDDFIEILRNNEKMLSIIVFLHNCYDGEVENQLKYNFSHM